MPGVVTERKKQSIPSPLNLFQGASGAGIQGVVHARHETTRRRSLFQDEGDPR
jgi:hypothetical protein